MGLFKKKPDPISERARLLNAEIAALEAEIKQLSNQATISPSTPRTPDSARISDPSPIKPQAAPPGARDPIFEDVNQDRLKSRGDTPVTREHYNELGVRKYDLAALVRRIRNHFRGPSTTNPKLVSYLAAGSIQGLRPMRYEKRVARNRFILLVIGFFLLLLGIISVFVKNN